MPKKGQNAQDPDKVNYCVAVVDQNAGKVILDLGNALPTEQFNGPLKDQGKLSLVCQGPQEVFLGFIPYTEEGWYAKTAGIVALPADRRLTSEELNILAENPLALFLLGSDHNSTLVASEYPGGLHVRADQFVFRLNPGDEAAVRLIATRFGQPYPEAQIVLVFDPSQLQVQDGWPKPAVPVDAIEYPPEVVAGSDGVATVTIRGYNPGDPRGYIDGQVYGVRPKLAETLTYPDGYPSNDCEFISLLIYNDFHADEPPTWYGSLQPIFQQYRNLYPVMDRFLDLADYDSICKHLELLRLAFSLEQENPNVMPVTRDLSTAKREAIIRWLWDVGPNGKPLLGTPPPATVVPKVEPAEAITPPMQDTQADKVSALNRRLALRPFQGQS